MFSSISIWGSNDSPKSTTSTTSSRTENTSNGRNYSFDMPYCRGHHKKTTQDLNASFARIKAQNEAMKQEHS